MNALTAPLPRRPLVIAIAVSLSAILAGCIGSLPSGSGAPPASGSARATGLPGTLVPGKPVADNTITAVSAPGDTTAAGAVPAGAVPAGVAAPADAATAGAAGATPAATAATMRVDTGRAKSEARRQASSSDELAARGVLPPPPMLPIPSPAAQGYSPMLRSMPGLMPPAESREQYGEIRDNGVMQVAEAPVSTFSIDVDTGSWSNVRRMLNAGRIPPRDAVRVEELVNYFPYDDARPSDGVPFAVHTAVAQAPWNPQKLVMRIAIKAEDKSVDALPPANLVFLVDVSGSMGSPDKLPLLKSSLKLLVERLRPQDRISLVTYASGTAALLEAVPGHEKARILNAIDALRAAGSTAGASGIEMAYGVARQGFIANGINRILLATDGDFNVGVTDFRQLKDLVTERRASGVSLSTLGFGTGNFNERLMEQLADAGDGAYSYIDTLMEGQKVLVTEMSSTLATVAKDVKIQVEFNPATVAEYRLIGYENRMLAREDFNDDKVDAGDVGAGHSVTALYELTPVGARTSIDPLRYGRPATRTAPADGTTPADGAAPDATPQHGAGRAAGAASEFAFVRLRYKRPEAGSAEAPSRLIERPVPATVTAWASTGADFRFATAIAGFGQVLRGGRHTDRWTIADARTLAAGALGADRFGYRAEALRLMDLAGVLSTRSAQAPVMDGPVRGGPVRN